MSPAAAAFQAGVEAMRAQVLEYLLNPQSGIGISAGAVSAIVSEVRAMHPGSVKAAVVSAPSIDRIGIIKRVRAATKAGLWETKVACAEADWDEAEAIKALGGAS